MAEVLHDYPIRPLGSERTHLLYGYCNASLVELLLVDVHKVVDFLQEFWDCPVLVDNEVVPFAVEVSCDSIQAGIGFYVEGD